MTHEDMNRFLKTNTNWGRWGADDDNGALNLVTPENRLAAVSLVKRGVTVSLARPLAQHPQANNPRPALHYMERRGRSGHPGAGVAADFVGLASHGLATTHLDALCHVWDEDGMWNGRDPAEHVTFDGATWATIDRWREGIVTRGVFLDVPAHRGTAYVDVGEPVTGEELTAVAAAQGVEVRPGDAVVVHSGRDAWEKEHGPYGAIKQTATGAPTGQETRPGLGTSCLVTLREWDTAVLVWDMLDATPNDCGLPFGVHAGIFAFGLALIDNAALGRLRETCQEIGAFEFLLIVTPLWIEGGTASPVNPVAVF